MNALGALLGSSGIAFGLDARAMSENELTARDAQLSWAMASASLSWAGTENYRPLAVPLPTLPKGWADWYEIGDCLQ
jgi:hypothetical protein